MAFDQVDKTIAINFFGKAIYGYRSITIDEYTTTAAPDLQAGFVEVGGEIYENTAALTITGWGGIANSTQAYIYIVPSGTTASAIFSSTAPTWSHAKQGYYNGNNRALWAIYKDGSGNYTAKSAMTQGQFWRMFGDLFVSNDLTVNNDLTVEGTATIALVSIANRDIECRDITVDGDAYIDSIEPNSGTYTDVNKLTVGTLRRVNARDSIGAIASLNTTGTTQAGSVLYTALAAGNPVGILGIASGGLYDGTNMYIVSRVNRPTPSTITIYASRASNGVPTTINLTSGSGGSYSWDISW